MSRSRTESLVMKHSDPTATIRITRAAKRTARNCSIPSSSRRRLVGLGDDSGTKIPRFAVANSLPDHLGQRYAQASSSQGLTREWLSPRTDPLRRNEKFLRLMRDITQDSLSQAAASWSVHATASPESILFTCESQWHWYGVCQGICRMTVSCGANS